MSKKRNEPPANKVQRHNTRSRIVSEVKKQSSCPERQRTREKKQQRKNNKLKKNHTKESERAKSKSKDKKPIDNQKLRRRYITSQIGSLEPLESQVDSKALKINSKVIEHNDQIKNLLDMFPINKQPIGFKLLYRASDHNFNAKNTKSTYCGIKNTVLLAKTQYGEIIGGYTPLEWKLSNDQDEWQPQKDPSGESFIFSLSNNDKLILELPEYNSAVIHDNNKGPIFATGIVIEDKSNTLHKSYTLHWDSMYYVHPQYKAKDSASWQKFNGVSLRFFYMIQWEVHQVIFFQNSKQSSILQEMEIQMELINDIEPEVEIEEDDDFQTEKLNKASVLKDNKLPEINMDNQQFKIQYNENENEIDKQPTATQSNENDKGQKDKITALIDIESQSHQIQKQNDNIKLKQLIEMISGIYEDKTEKLKKKLDNTIQEKEQFEHSCHKIIEELMLAKERLQNQIRKYEELEKLKSDPSKEVLKGNKKLQIQKNQQKNNLTSKKKKITKKTANKTQLKNMSAKYSEKDPQNSDSNSVQIEQQNKLTSKALNRINNNPDLNANSQSFVNKFKIDSKVIQYDHELINLLQMFSIHQRPTKFKLLYRASNNNFDVKNKHKYCDIAHTVLLVKTQFGKVIGGYTPLKWKINDWQTQKDESGNSFVFSLSSNHKLSLQSPKEKIAIYHFSSYGPRFNGDICINNKSNTVQSSALFSNELPYVHLKYKPNDEQSFRDFVGTSNGWFLTKQWEVHRVFF